MNINLLIKTIVFINLFMYKIPLSAVMDGLVSTGHNRIENFKLSHDSPYAHIYKIVKANIIINNK